MEWNLEVGSQIKALERVEDQTGKTPAMLDERPRLFDLLCDEWDAFAMLDKARQNGFNGPQPISLTDIEAYCRLNDPPDRDQLIHYIQKLDDSYLKWYVKRQKKEKKSSGRT